tara:strand:+ start:77 stop:1057 length:981 start_codon:yes stop_codon:yes gene_type:complete
MWEGYLAKQQKIDFIKREFLSRLCRQMQLVKCEGPLLTEQGTGLQDDLSGIERPVEVNVSALPDKQYQVVHSLAKWKRQLLADYQAPVGQGIVVTMSALRPDEETLDETHSVFVDQWDWEKVIAEEQRSMQYLKQQVQLIYAALTATEGKLRAIYGGLSILPRQLTFISSETLRAEYPELTAKQRENKITEAYGAVFVYGIGAPLSDGKKHDERAPDYDDWSTQTEHFGTGLNGDLLVWSPKLQKAIELSSMGIRVDAAALKKQLELTEQTDRLKLAWHQRLAAGELPLTIGGGIGQSRVVMLLLQADHIAQVQCGVWQPGIQEAL